MNSEFKNIKPAQPFKFQVYNNALENEKFSAIFRAKTLFLKFRFLFL